MKDMFVSESYFLCAVQKKGKIFSYDSAKIACLLAAILWEAEQAGAVSVPDGRIIPAPELPPDTPWLTPFWEHLREMDTPNFKHLLQDYSSGFSDRHLNALTQSLGDRLDAKGLVTKAKLGLFGGRTYFMPRRDSIPALTAELKVDILFQTPPSTDSTFLWLLLEKSSCIPETVTDEDRRLLREKVTSFLQQSAGSELARLNALADRLISLSESLSVFFR